MMLWIGAVSLLSRLLLLFLRQKSTLLPMSGLALEMNLTLGSQFLWRFSLSGALRKFVMQCWVHAIMERMMLLVIALSAIRSFLRSASWRVVMSIQSARGLQESLVVVSAPSVISLLVLSP